jgi:Tol biopolymer transport system component
MARASRFLAAAFIMAAGCGPLDNSSSRRDKGRATLLATQGIHIVAMERGPSGGRLVMIGENGDRLGDLTRLQPGAEAVRDNSPAWSPDGRWLVFASSRERGSLVETSLWIIPARTDAQPRRLTQGKAVDRDPAWTPDSKAVVFSSNRGGSFDLWRLDLASGPDGWPEAAGQPIQLTRGEHHEFHPSIDPSGDTSGGRSAAAGERIVYMRVDRDGSRSSLWLWSSGTETELTTGPADMTPAWSPDGRTIAFAAPSLERDADLHAIDPDGSNRRLIIIEPLSDQTGPVWSGDGRYLFSTSMYRSVATGKPILSSITFVDMYESPLVMRALHDSSMVESRTSPALDRADLDAAALHRNLTYKDALKRTVERELNLHRNDAPEQPRTETPR